LGSEDVFKAYLSTVYDDKVLRGFEHSLYYVGDAPDSDYKEPARSTEATGHHEGIRIDEHFISNMVVIDDALFEIGVWQDMDTLQLKIEANGSLAPTLYEYLTGDPVVAGEIGCVFPSLLNKLDIR
tara:strand:- start:1512 stop:1889 length:378 start_codon:yes stop_codon:yes gene_type:complete